MKKGIDDYRLTSLEEPSDEYLSIIMKEVAADAKRENEEATKRYFSQINGLYEQAKERLKAQGVVLAYE